MMRRRGPGLLRVAATTAVVAGTATAVSGRVSRRQQARYETEDMQRQQAMYAANEPVQAPELDYTAELNELARLKQQGIINEDEFQAKKKQILGI